MSMETPSSNNAPSSRPMLMTIVGVLLVVTTLIVVVFDRTTQSSASSDRPVILTTIPPMHWLLTELAGDRADVHNLLPAGASPHTYEPTPDKMRLAQSALVLVSVHPHLDGWATRLGVKQKLEAAALVKTELLGFSACVHFDEAGNRIDHDHSHDHGSSDYGDADPHLWTSPSVMANLANALAVELARLDPDGAKVYSLNATRVSQELIALDDELATTLKPLKGTPYMQFHPALNYFMDRYDLVSVGAVEVAPGKQPTPRELADLKQTIKDHSVRAIFIEPQLARNAADALAGETGVQIIEVDPLGGVPGRTSLAELLRFNAAQLLGGGRSATD